MADEEVKDAVSPPPSVHKRKLDDLDSEPLEQSIPAPASNGNSESVVDGAASINGVAQENPEAKRPRLDDKPDDFEGENVQEELAEEPKEDDEQSALERNTEQEDDQGKADGPIDALDKEVLTDETHTSAIAQQSAEYPEESAKGERQELSEERKDPPPDATQQGNVSGVGQQVTSAGQLTSRKIEVPSNKVGVLIGKGGDTIRTLQHSSGARIQITRDADADPNSATRPVELIGSLENISKAEKLIKDVIAEADAGGSPLLVAKGFSNVQSSVSMEQIQIQVPNEKAGTIIGKGGETIKYLQTRSGARIQLIPQHLPEGDQSKERTVRITGDKKQIEMAKEMIKEALNQPIRSATPTSGYNQNFRTRGPGSQWGSRSHPSQPTGYNYPQRGPYSSQNSQYYSQGYGHYPPQQPTSGNNFGWEQRPPTNMQGPPEHAGYDYYGGQGGHTAAPSGPPPMHSHTPGPGPMMGPPPSQANYNYGRPQGPDYGQQHPYGAHGPTPLAYLQGNNPVYGQQDQYGKPPTYNVPQSGPYAQPYGQPKPSQPGDVPYQGSLSSTQSYGTNVPAQQPYSYASSGAMQQAYTQHSAAPQSGQSVSGYAQSGYTATYGQYPPAQPGFTEQAPAPNSAGYGYQGAADSTYAGGLGTAYSQPPAGQPAAYSQPAPVQPGYDQSIPQSGGYGNVPVPYGKSVSPQPQPGYAQYDNSQMYVGHR